MVTINQSTFKQNLYETLYDLLIANLSIGTVVGGFIPKLETMPEVVLGKPVVSPVTVSIDGSLKVFEVNIVISVFSTKNKECDLIGDELRTILLSNESTLFNGNDLYDMDLVEEDGGENLVEGKEVHSTVFTISFRWDVRI